MFNREVAREVAKAVAEEAERAGAARVATDTIEFTPLPG